MIYRFSIPGRLPGLNEIISATRHNRFRGAYQKRVHTERCAWEIRSKKVPHFLNPVVVRLMFIEPNRRRDVDNVQSGSKFILDGLKAAGCLVDDSRRWVRAVRPHVSDVVDKVNPRIEVEIEECE